MNIILNGEQREISGTTVADVLAEMGLEKARVATALNGEFLPAALRRETSITAGDTLEVLSAMQGG